MRPGARRRSQQEESTLLRVTVVRFGGRPVPVEFDEDDELTVEEAVEQAGFTIKERDHVTVNGDEAELDNIVEDGDQIVLSSRMQGGC